MKTVNKICQVLSIVFGLASLALFFMNFAVITVGGTEESLIGAVLAFGAKKTLSTGVVADMAKSSDILLCFLLTATAFIMSIFSFKKKGLRYAVPAFSLGSAIYMLVITLRDAKYFVDCRAALDGGGQLGDMVSAVKYTPFVLICAIVLFAFFFASVAYLLIDDYIEVLESKGSKKTILKRIALFFRDYKSEVKKIVWPGYKDVLKNTLIVLVMCLLVGAFIWLLDYGLGSLIKVILGVSSK